MLRIYKTINDFIIENKKFILIGISAKTFSNLMWNEV